MLPPDELIHHQGYLISRGVRALSLIGTVEANDDEMLRAYNKLQFMEFGTGCGHEPIPAVMERKGSEPSADVGFAAHSWVVDTLKWASDNAPQPHLNRILGLLLGYSPAAISALDESESGKLFPR